MMQQGRMVILLAVLALAACAQGITGQTPTPYAPDPPGNNGDRHGGMDM